MYFLDQIREQFLSNIVNYAGEIQGAGEQTKVEPTEIQSTLPDDPVEAAKVVGSKAEVVTARIDAAVQAEEGRGLIDQEVGGREGGSNPREIVLSKFPVSDTELASVRGELGEDASDADLRQAVLENKLKAYHTGELPDEDKAMIEALFSDAGLDDIPMEISIDALESGEIDDIGTDLTPKELGVAQSEIGDQVTNLNTKINNLPPGAERKILEKRRGLLGLILDIIEGKTNQGGIVGEGFVGVESNGSHNVVETAKEHLGVHENSGGADKFLMGMARSARKTPWCAGFVSYVCQQAGYEINPTLSSKAFIGETGKGHVAFNIGGGKMLGGNQSDQVSIKNINKPVVGWIMPEDYAAGKPAQKSGNAPVGAIIVFDRSSSQRNVS